MASIFGYIRTSRRLQEWVPEMDSASQKLQLRRAGVPLANIHRDVGVSSDVDTGCWAIGAEAEGVVTAFYKVLSWKPL